MLRTVNLVVLILMCCIASPLVQATQYQRNKAVPVEKVLFGKVLSVRHITERELIADQRGGWQVFGGALIGATLGHQFGRGRGKAVATILGGLIGASIADNHEKQHQERVVELIELFIKADDGDEYMVVQYKDNTMHFKSSDAVRIVYLSTGFVRVDLQR